MDESLRNCGGGEGSSVRHEPRKESLEKIEQIEIDGRNENEKLGRRGKEGGQEID